MLLDLSYCGHIEFILNKTALEMDRAIYINSVNSGDSSASGLKHLSDGANTQTYRLNRPRGQYSEKTDRLAFIVRSPKLTSLIANSISLPTTNFTLH